MIVQKVNVETREEHPALEDSALIWNEYYDPLQLVIIIVPNEQVMLAANEGLAITLTEEETHARLVARPRG